MRVDLAFWAAFLRDIAKTSRLYVDTLLLHTTIVVRISYCKHPLLSNDLWLCISLYPYVRDLGIADAGAQYGGTPKEYRQALRDAVAACPTPNVHLIEGPDILTDIRGLTHDMIHPGDHGMIEMGRNLAHRLNTLIGTGTAPKES